LETRTFSIAQGDGLNALLPFAIDGHYAGSFAILGGSDVGAGDLLGSANFNVDVIGGAVPEPSNLVLLLSGLVGLGTTLRRRLTRYGCNPRLLFTR
jgi:hypothetical protein